NPEAAHFLFAGIARWAKTVFVIYGSLILASSFRCFRLHVIIVEQSVEQSQVPGCRYVINLWKSECADVAEW
ncbi:MAG TPA: hypothetical protein VIR01_09365, partial [Pyrinomonadaceae bacterium]